jgi:anti-sigma B factor antagonist
MERPKKADPYAVEEETPQPAATGRPHDKPTDLDKADQSEPTVSASRADRPGAAATGARFSSQVLGGVHIIEFSRSDVLDAQYIEQLGDEIYRHLKPVEQPRVVVDLHNVRFLSSSALGMLVALRKVVVERKGGKMGIANVAPEIRQVFKMTKLHKVLNLQDTTEKAVRSVV